MYCLSRKWKAKKSRETRKKTQPVPANLFEQLSIHNSKEGVEGGSKEGGGGVQGGSVVSEGGDTVRKEVERERMQFVEQLRTDAQDETVITSLTMT